MRNLSLGIIADQGIPEAARPTHPASLDGQCGAVSSFFGALGSCASIKPPTGSLTISSMHDRRMLLRYEVWEASN